MVVHSKMILINVVNMLMSNPNGGQFMGTTDWWESENNWTPSLLKKRLIEIKKLDWQPITSWITWSKKDDGQVGQCNERMFGVEENNDEGADLKPDIELKAIRATNAKITLKHSSNYESDGLSARKIFDKYAYPKKNRLPGTELKGNKMELANRIKSIAIKIVLEDDATKRQKLAAIMGVKDADVERLFSTFDFQKLTSANLKEILQICTRYETHPSYKRLSIEFEKNDFSKPVGKHTSTAQTTDIGDEIKKDYFSIDSDAAYKFIISHRTDGELFTNDMSVQWKKLQKVLITIYETKGGTGTKDEKFRLVAAYLCNDVEMPGVLLDRKILDLTFSMTQNEKYPPPKYHNRSDKYRIKLPQNGVERLKRLKQIWKSVEKLL